MAFVIAAVVETRDAQEAEPVESGIDGTLEDGVDVGSISDEPTDPAQLTVWPASTPSTGGVLAIMLCK